MRYLSEYRDGRAAGRYARLLKRLATRPWTVMEVCGGQTHSIVKFGVDRLLPEGLDLVHGPGCPVCVTPLEQIDRALAIARRPGVLFCPFGDMLRVPGSAGSLLHARPGRGNLLRRLFAHGRPAHGPGGPEQEVVFFAVGFETTARPRPWPREGPAGGVRNFSLLVSHVLSRPPWKPSFRASRNRVQGFWPRAMYAQ